MMWTSDLLCGEEFGTLDDSPDCVTDDPELPSDSEESIAGFLVLESVYLPGFDYPERLRARSVNPFTRSESVDWILEVKKYFGFGALTAYLAVNYMDRFLACHHLPADGWALQLLSVACLSLAAKMEETLVPSLLDLQVEGTRYIFEPRTIRRMEFLVLTALDWRLRSVTPFTFLDYFAYKADSSGKYMRNLISRATQIILNSIHDIDLLDQSPSSMAAAAMICATDTAPSLSFITPEIAASWCIGLSEEAIGSCYKLMQQIILKSTQRKQPVILSQNRVTSITCNSDSGVSSPSPSPPSKRRRLA